MRYSRGMGAISKEKVRAIKKRDGNEPVMLYKAGGRVKKFEEGGKIVGRMSDGKPVVVNPDGRINTHIMATGEFDGKGINYPTIYGGKKMSKKAAEDFIKKNNFVDPDTGKKLREYPSGDDAEVDYMLRQHPQIDREASYIKDKAEGRYAKGGKVGLYANIHAKQARIAAGSKEKMRKPNSPGAPTNMAFTQSAKTAKKK
jgi:hypothetical protein